MTDDIREQLGKLGDKMDDMGEKIVDMSVEVTKIQKDVEITHSSLRDVSNKVGCIGEWQRTHDLLHANQISMKKVAAIVAVLATVIGLLVRFNII